jgi:hypothetical protein
MKPQRLSKVSPKLNTLGAGAKRAILTLAFCILALAAARPAQAQTAACSSFFPGQASTGYLAADDVCTVVLQGTITLVYPTGALGCTVQINVKALTITAGDDFVPGTGSTWPGVIQEASGIAGSMGPLSGTAAISSCAAPVGNNNPVTSASLSLWDQAGWYLQCQEASCSGPASQYTFQFGWGGFDGNANFFGDSGINLCNFAGSTYCGSSPAAASGQLTITNSSVSGSFTGLTSSFSPISSASVCLASPGTTPNCSSSGGTPTITSLSTLSVQAGSQPLSLTVIGTNFTSGATVQWTENGQTTSIEAQVFNSTTLTVSIPSNLLAAAGTATIAVASGGVTSAQSTFQITQLSDCNHRTLGAGGVLSPCLGPMSFATNQPYSATVIASQGANLYLAVSGSNPPFQYQITGATPTGVQIDNVADSSSTIMNELFFTGYPTANGLFAFTVTATDAVGNQYSQAFTITVDGVTTGAPTITSLSNSSAPVGTQNLSLTVTGTNFATGATVQWTENGQTTSLNAQVGSSEALTVAVPANLLMSPGTASIAVSSGGSVSGTVVFTIQAVTLLGCDTSSFSVNLTTATFGPTGGEFGTQVSAQTGCAWSVASLPSWISAIGSSTGTGPGQVSLTVAPNSGALRSVTFTIANVPVTITQVAPPSPVLATDVTVLNSGPNAGNFSISFLGNEGGPASVPVQSPSGAPVPSGETASLSGTVPPYGTQFYELGNISMGLVAGWGRLTADPSITVQVLIRVLGTDGNYYEASVPSTTGSTALLLAYDATTFQPTGAQIYTGFALANLDQNNVAAVSCQARDTNGNPIPNGVPVPQLQPNGHWAQYLFSALTGTRGTISCTSNTSIAAIGLRIVGSALSTLPVLSQ